MPTNRRNLIKAGGLALAASVAAPTLEAAAPPRRERGMATGLTLLQIQRDGRSWLAVKLEKGIVVAADAARLLGLPAPETMDQLLQEEDGPRLNALVKAVLASPRSAELYLKGEPAEYAPALSHPGKIVCVGFNYLAHLNETGTALPKVPVLFCKYNNTINRHGGTIKLPTKVATKFDYEVELIIAMGKRAHDVSEADALSYVAGYAVGNDFTIRADRPASRHRRSNRSDKPEHRMPGQWRDATVVQHRQDAVQLPPIDQLHIPGHHPRSGRHHLHRHTRGRDLRHAEGQAEMAGRGRQDRLQCPRARRVGVHADLRNVGQPSGDHKAPLRHE